MSSYYSSYHIRKMAKVKKKTAALRLLEELNRCKQLLTCSSVWPLQMFLPKGSITPNITSYAQDETMTSSLKNA